MLSIFAEIAPLLMFSCSEAITTDVVPASTTTSALAPNDQSIEMLARAGFEMIADSGTEPAADRAITLTVVRI